MGGTTFIEHGGPGEASEIFLQLVDAARREVDAAAEEQDQEDLRRGYGSIRERPRSEDEDTGTIGDKLGPGFITVHDTPEQILAAVEKYDNQVRNYRSWIGGGGGGGGGKARCVAELQLAPGGAWTPQAAEAAAVLLLHIEDPRCDDKYGPCAHIACGDGTHVFFGWSNE